MGNLSDRDISNLLYGCFSGLCLKYGVIHTKALKGIEGLVDDYGIGKFHIDECNKYIDLFNQVISLKAVLARSESWVVNELEEIDRLFVRGDLTAVIERIKKLKVKGLLVPSTEVGELFNQFEDVANTEFELAINFLAEDVELLFSSMSVQ